MAVNWQEQVLEQLEWHWHGQARPRLDGLTDEEYRWEPVAGGWNIRPRTEHTPPDAPGTGEWTIDFAYPEPQPAPVTTIAWRLAHVVVGVLGMRAQNHFGATFDWGPADYAAWRYAGTAGEALAQLDAAHDAWVAGVRALSEDELARPVGDKEPGHEEGLMAELVLHIHREVIHHLAEVALLRDLHAHR
ncbi:DinB family protein [Desertihabitans brevis]|uniref:DinB family protein n=1 Tax=Desertihabitans brevis TaxID=2268447 RepID=A0A367YS31_9ACTN|nr:DinB family protein [Desertihabitans brevis]RCK68359.1 DinB family protein [Desertihabitans brevis]